METTLYKIIDICQSNHIETTFIQELHQNGLIQITVLESQEFVDEDQLSRIERFSNWYYDLELNVQGIEVVQHLLTRIEDLQVEIRNLRK